MGKMMRRRNAVCSLIPWVEKRRMEKLTCCHLLGRLRATTTWTRPYSHFLSPQVERKGLGMEAGAMN